MKKIGKGEKVAIGVSAGVLVLGIICFVAVFSFLRSCSAFLHGSDKQHDPRKVKEYIADTNVTERDLEVFDILQTSFEAIYLDNQILYGAGEQTKEPDPKQKREVAKAYVMEYRSKLEDGKWPGTDSVFASIESANSPQLWVRIAQLAQDHIEEETGEQWQILSFSYPYLGWDLLPPAFKEHQIDDALITNLECISGPDKGLAVDVGYYRWADPAYFSSNLDQRKEALNKKREKLEKVEDAGLLKGRDYTMKGDYQNLYVWSTGEEDPLRDPQTFSDTLIALEKEIGADGLELFLVEKDAPVFLERSFEAEEYYLEEVYAISPKDAKDALLLNMCKSDSLSFAPADILLSQMVYSEDNRDDGMTGEIHGYLATKKEKPLYDWRSIDEDVKADDVLAALVADQLGTDESNVMVFSGIDSSGYNFDDIVIKSGILPETNDEMEEVLTQLQHTIWQYTFVVAGSEDLYSLFTTLYVIEDDSLERDSTAAGFDELKEAVMQDKNAVNSFSAPWLLRADISSHAYANEVENVAEGYVGDCNIDLEGPITESREWYLALADDMLVK